MMKKLLIFLLLFTSLAHGQNIRKWGSTGATNVMYGGWKFLSHPTYALGDSLEPVDFKIFKDSLGAIRAALGLGGIDSAGVIGIVNGLPADTFRVFGVYNRGNDSGAASIKLVSLQRDTVKTRIDSLVAAAARVNDSLTRMRDSLVSHNARIKAAGGGGGGGGYGNIIAQADFSGSATYAIDMSAYYGIYHKIVVEYSNLKFANNYTVLAFRSSADGSTFHNTSLDYAYSYDTRGGKNSVNDAGSGAFISTYVPLSDRTSNASGYSASLTITINRPDLTQYPSFEWNFNYHDGDNQSNWSKGAAYYVGSQEQNKGLQLVNSSGAISGHATIIGY